MRKLILALFFLSAGLLGAVEKWSMDDFLTRFREQSTKADIINLCRQFAQNATDMEVIRLAQDNWLTYDAQGVTLYFKEKYEATPSSPEATYLYGRMVDDPLLKIRLGKEIIAEKPDWSYGYRLITTTYVIELFEKKESNAVTDSLKASLVTDFPLFQKLAKLENDGDYPLQYLFSYYIYKLDFKNALAILERGRAKGYYWADMLAFAGVSARDGNFEKSLAFVEQHVRFLIEKGEVKQEDMQRYVQYYYGEILKKAGQYEEAVRYYKTLPKWDSDTSNLISLGTVYGIMKDYDQAFFYLNQAAEKGFSSVMAVKNDEELKNLQQDPRWQGFIQKIQTAWKKQAASRKKETLAAILKKPAPDFTLKTPDGNPVTLASLKGKVVVLDFWATWCNPCKMAMPVVSDWVKTKKPVTVKVYSVNIWEKDPSKAVEYFASQGLSQGLLLGNNEIAQDYQIKSIPYICVIDQDGYIRFEQNGFSESLEENLNWWIEALIK